MVRRHGIAPPAHPPAKSAEASGRPFFPNHLLRSFSVAAVVCALMVTLAAFWPRPIGDPANPSVLPDSLIATWIVVDVSRALTHYLGAWGFVAFTLLGLSLALVPLFDRGPERDLRRRPAVAASVWRFSWRSFCCGSSAAGCAPHEEPRPGGTCARGDRRVPAAPRGARATRTGCGPVGRRPRRHDVWVRCLPCRQAHRVRPRCTLRARHQMPRLPRRRSLRLRTPRGPPRRLHRSAQQSRHRHAVRVLPLESRSDAAVRPADRPACGVPLQPPRPSAAAESRSQRADLHRLPRRPHDSASRRRAQHRVPHEHPAHLRPVSRRQATDGEVRTCRRIKSSAFAAAPTASPCSRSRISPPPRAWDATAPTRRCRRR